MKKQVLDPAKLTGAQKAAVFLITMGEEYASKVFTRMNDDEIREVATEMSQIDKITPEVLAAVSENFVTTFEGETSIVVEGESFLKNVMDRALDNDKAKALFKDIEDRRRDMPFVWSRNVNTTILANYIEGEHPQTVAMILAHLPSEIASDVLVSMPEDRKADIALRIAMLGQVPEEIVRAVDDALRSELGNIGGSGGKVGGLSVLVDILNGVDKATEDIIMELIEEEQAEMAGDIRSMMFVFEDLNRVDDKGMREILKRVEGNQLTLALKTASEEMRQKIFANLSQRAAEMLSEDLEVMGPVRLAEVEEAQQAIVTAAKELEAEGSIVLGGKGKDDILV